MSNLETEYPKEVVKIVSKSGSLLRSRFGLWFLAIVSFADSALSLPIITDPFLVAYILANRSKAFLGTFVAIGTSVLGGVMIYLMAAFFINYITRFFSVTALDTFQQMAESLNQGTFALAFLGAITPLPYSFVAIAAGAFQGNFLMFVLGSLLGRALRFGIIGYFTYTFGERALAIAKKNILLFSVLAVILFAAYFSYQYFL